MAHARSEARILKAYAIETVGTKLSDPYGSAAPTARAGEKRGGDGWCGAAEVSPDTAMGVAVRWQLGRGQVTLLRSAPFPRQAHGTARE